MKKVLLIADVRDWAYDIIARNIKKHSTEYIYDIAYEKDIMNDLVKIDYDDYDIVFCFYWANIRRYGRDKIKNFSIGKTCVGIHSFNSWKKRGMTPSQVMDFCKDYAGVSVPCVMLKSVFGNKVLLTRTGFDPEYFYKVDMPVGPLKFLFCANLDKNNHRDIKGYYDIVKPVFDRRNDVELIVQTRDNQLANEKMIDFYKKGHILICASSSEGGPMPVVEALACGRSIISTKVGFAVEIVKEYENGIFIESNKESLNEAIDHFISIHKGNNLSIYSESAHSGIQSRQWKYAVRDYENFFGYCIRSIEDGMSKKDDLQKTRDFWNVNTIEEAKFGRVSKSKTLKSSKSGFDDDSIKKLIDDYILVRPIEKGASILDFGCGVGRILKHMTDKSDFCYGVDISPSMLEYAKEHIGNNKVSLSLYDNIRIPLKDESMDLVYTFHVLQHIPTKEKLMRALSELFRVQKAGGMSILHFIYKVSESDKEPGSFAGYRPSKATAISICTEVGYSFRDLKYASRDGSFVLYLEKL